MRSVFAFTTASRREIEVVLDDLATDDGHGGWTIQDRVWVSVDDPPDWIDGFEDVRPLVEATLGTDIRLVVGDVSGRIEGSEEARRLALAILALGPGVALDDHDETFWTADDLRSTRRPAGRRPFFSPR